MIKLTNYQTCEALYVNPAHIISFSGYGKDGTVIIQPYHEDGSHINVQESPEEVVRLIEEEKQTIYKDTSIRDDSSSVQIPVSHEDAVLIEYMCKNYPPYHFIQYSERNMDHVLADLRKVLRIVGGKP